MSTTPRPGKFTLRRPVRPVRAAVATAAVLGAATVGILAFGPPQMLLAADESGSQISGFAGKCVDVADGNSANGTQVQLYDCNGTEAQRWTMPGDGTIRAFGKCLDVWEKGTAAGTSVQLWDCHGGPNQQWVVSEAQDIVNPAADKCLDVRGYNSANRTPLQIWTCTGAANEKWTVAKKENPPTTGGGDSGGTTGGTTGGSTGGDTGGSTGGTTGGSTGGSTGGDTGGSTGGGDDHPGDTPGKFVVSEGQFNEMFPARDSLYSYKGLTAALNAFPAFATSGDDTTKKREAAAFLANVSHETGGLAHVVEQNTANYSHYCDPAQAYGCPAGQNAYYGRGPIQLSWNYNYKAAGDALGLDLLNNPAMVEKDSSVAWQVGLWYWNTQSGPGTMTPHDAMANGVGFGNTIRSINGSLECDGKNPAQVQSRVDTYQHFTQILGVDPGKDLSC
ncbi:glycoside hydrolase family 19 protein [Streptomyces sp. NPDC054796]